MRRRTRRRKGGRHVREPQGDDVAQAGRDHEAQEQGAARAARDDPAEAFKAGGKTAVTSVKIPKDVAGEMESVLKGLGTDFSQAVRLLTLQTTALGGMPFAAGIRRKAS